MIKKILTGLLLTALSLKIFAAPLVVDSVVAVVNNNVILESDVNQILNNLRSTTDAKNLPDEATLKSQVIERLIVEKLILARAAKAKITVSDEELTEAIKEIAQNNDMTPDDLRGHLSDSGISYSSYQERIRNEMLIERARLHEVRQRITISDKEVENLAATIAKQPLNNREINISHILISVPENPTKSEIETASNKAKEVINRLHKGESFAKLAIAYSGDDNALKGGSMGWSKLNELPTMFEERLVRAQKGDIIGPLRSGVGYHILHVDDIRTEKTQNIIVKEVNAEHILIKTNVLVTDEIAKQQLLDIRASIENKTMSFESAAKLHSEDTGSAENGGKLGWNDPNKYDPAFKNALLKLKKGQISQPIKSSFGWHLIKLIDERSVDKTDSARKEQAFRLIFNRKFSEELQVWIQELRGDAYVEIITKDKQ